MDTLVNIYVPTYEPKPEHLRAALHCISSQTEKRWTALIHDDCSKKDVRATVEPYLSDPRFEFSRSPDRLGIGGNWNACLKHGVAPYIQYLFQDDLWEPQYLARAIEPLVKDERIGIVAMEHAYKYEDEPPWQNMYETLRETRNKLLKKGKNDGREFLRMWIQRELHPNLIGEPSFVMLRRSLVEKVGPFAEDMPQFLDEEYWLRCLLQSDLHCVMESSGAFRVHAGAASARNEASGAGIYDRLRCFERLIAMLPRGELRTEAIHARNRSLESMARKFLTRLKVGKKVPGGNGQASLKSLALQHPFLSARALLKALIQ